MAGPGQAPKLDDYGLGRRALDSVHGVDMNPFAWRSPRFRLLVAALKVAGVTTLAPATRQRWRPIIGCTDSLRTSERQQPIAAMDEAIGYRALGGRRRFRRRPALGVRLVPRRGRESALHQVLAVHF